MSLPYFNYYPKDMGYKTMHLTLAEFGAYNRLLSLCWTTPGCSIPKDIEWIARKMLIRSEQDKAVLLAILDEFFKGISLIGKSLQFLFHLTPPRHAKSACTTPWYTEIGAMSLQIWKGARQMPDTVKPLARRNEIRWVSSLVGDLPEPMLSVRMCQLCIKTCAKMATFG